MSFDDIRNSRVEKLNRLRATGVDPYPATCARTHSIAEALVQFEALSSDAHEIVLAGRIMAHRTHGGISFIDLDDGSGAIQGLVGNDRLGDEPYQFFLSVVDVGDIIEITGALTTTKRGERSIDAKKWRMLTKSIRPLPEKWHGLQDVEERYRRRYLDLLFNPNVKKVFETRTKIVQSMRDFMNTNGFVEVTTPTLQPLYGGASARPFKTHLHALDVDLFLRIAPELYLKRLLVGGFTDIYEFTTNFRNEGMDRDHNPEFSAMEFYAAYKDINWAMDYTEKLFTHILTTVFDGLAVSYQGNDINFKPPFHRERFADILKEHTNIDYEHTDDDAIRAKATELGIVIKKTVTKAGLADELFKKVIRPKLIQPMFVTDYPAELLPLAKRMESRDFVQAFQFFAGGLELIKAFGELNDPQDQQERMQSQENQRAKGDEEAQRLDEDFIEALECGMPPAAGWGIGIDRFVTLLTDSRSIRDVILFPLMRPNK